MVMRGLWKVLWKPTSRFSFGAILIAGSVAGVIFWGGFNTFMEYTNTLEFCVSCHEMEQKVYKEYKKSVHYTNPSGVRAVCSDCHVPKEWFPKLIRKIQASNELLHMALGTIDTPEKFEANRYRLAKNVWASMERTDSRECRNCHDYSAMHWDKQRKRAKEKMQVAYEEKKTCIACHKGIAHTLPAEYLAQEEDDDDDDRPVKKVKAAAKPAVSMDKFLEEED
ncbi:MAG: NapC/NirT family cytochrome c [Magnetovibrio sp.]|nr:NapC/NirT family cytochrome c [Magnetovibrio sp.]